jgi:rubrerythrin
MSATAMKKMKDQILEERPYGHGFLSYFVVVNGEERVRVCKNVCAVCERAFASEKPSEVCPTCVAAR